eukprot:5083330-Alexandrium_andersonii.AAC.1
MPHFEELRSVPDVQVVRAVQLYGERPLASPRVLAQLAPCRGRRGVSRGCASGQVFPEIQD